MDELTRRGAILGVGVGIGAVAAGVAGCSGAEPVPGSAELGSTADIPEGGGTIFTAAEVVVTQPAKGEFKGFSAKCTHRGCIVKTVAGGTINCECHGSKFGLDGSVVNGPAAEPLPEQQLRIDGDKIFTA